MGAHDCPVLQCLACLLSLSNLLLPHRSLVWASFCYSLIVLIGQLCSHPGGQPKLSLSEAERACLPEWITSLSLQALLSPSLDMTLEFRFAFSTLAFSSFLRHSLYLGPGHFPRHNASSRHCSLRLPFFLSGGFFLFPLKCKVLFKYYFHHEVFLCSVLIF